MDQSQAAKQTIIAVNGDAKTKETHLTSLTHTQTHGRCRRITQTQKTPVSGAPRFQMKTHPAVVAPDTAHLPNDAAFRK